MKIFCFAFLICIRFVTTSVFAQTPAYSAEVQQRIREVENNLVGSVVMSTDTPGNILNRMKTLKENGVSIAVIRNYQLEWAKGYGMADDSSKTPVTSATLFQAASISKSLNSVGVIKLAQNKKLDLYADINNYLTSWKFPYDSVTAGKKISTIELLSHTAGTTVHGFGGYERGKPLPTIVQILNGTPPANSEAVRSELLPGTRYVYSGGGVTISQLIVTDITHKDYAAYMFEEVLKPMGMTASSFDQPNRGNPKLLATAYGVNGQQIPGKYHIYPEQAAAGLWTNPTDLAKYIIETQLAYEGKSSKVLNQSMTKLRLTPYENNATGPGTFIDSLDGMKYFSHSGGNEGFRCQYYGSFEGGNGLVIMVNSDNGKIIPELVNSIAKVYHLKGLYRSTARTEAKVDSNVLENYVGNYQLMTNVVMKITRSQDQLFVQLTGQPKLLLYAESASKFFLKVVDAQIEFVKDGSGKANTAKLFQNGATLEAPRIQ